MNEYAPWYDAPIPPVNYRFGKFARAPSSVTATWADSHQLMFSKDNHRMTTNLRSYFDRPRELLDNSGLNERRPLQVTWTLGGSGPLTTSKSAPSLGKTRKPMTKSEHKLKSRPEWNSSCFFHLGSENNSVAHDAQRKYFRRTIELGNCATMPDRVYPTPHQDTLDFRGRLHWS